LCDKLVIDEARCSGCASCVKICPFAALGMSELQGTLTTANRS
jgi:Fe-S-cluster-containing hydrogenase component 2